MSSLRQVSQASYEALGGAVNGMFASAALTAAGALIGGLFLLVLIPEEDEDEEYDYVDEESFAHEE